MVRRYRPPVWHLALSGLVIAAAIIAVLYLQWQSRPAEIPPLQAALPPPSKPEPPKGVDDLANTLYTGADEILEEMGIWAALIRKTRAARPLSGTASLDTIVVKVPADLPLASVNLALTLFVEYRGGRIIRAIERQRPASVEIRCGLAGLPTTLFLLKSAPHIQRRTGKIAIVLDDFGSMSNLVERFCALPQALTLAVLPNEGQVNTIVGLARDKGHEVLVHLPMEPEDYPAKNPGENAIFAHQDSTAIGPLVRAALRKIPGAVGFNNHMGSRTTADPRIMRQVLREIKKHDLLFLDSRTTASSVAYDMARAMAIPTAQRDLFIDPVDTTEAVEKKLWELAALAVRQGQAVGIGHDREQTLLALENMLPRLEARGFSFVSISELAH